MNPFRVAALGALVLLSACKKEEELVDLFATVGADVSGVWVGEASGTVAVSVPTYATNSFGVPVPVENLTLSSDGTLDARAVTPDATAWATATVTDAVGVWAVTAVTGTAQATGHVAITGSSPSPVAFPAWGTPVAPQFVLAAGNGVASATGNDLWWTGTEGLGVTRVGSFPSDVKGFDGAEGDGDGVTDAVVWTSDAVVLLRGRAAGGLYWGGGWQTTEGEVRGATARDLDGDGAMDLAVLTVADGSSTVSIYGGDGAWNFHLADQLVVPYEAWSVSAEDFDLDGVREVTLLTSDALVRRYARFDDGWSVSGSYEYDVALLEGARLYPSADLTADGVEDLVVGGPDETGTGYQAWVIDAGANATVFRMFNDGSTTDLPLALSMAVEEISGDGVDDLLMLTESTLFGAFWNVTNESFTLYAFTDVPAAGPIGAADLTDDTVTDVVIGGSQLTLMPGQRVADDPETAADETVAWKIATPSAKVTDFSLGLPPVLRDLDGDGVVDLVSAADTAGGLQLQVYGGQPADDDSAEGFRSRGAVVLSTTGTALDLAVCGDQVYVTVAETSATYLHHYHLNSSGAPVSSASPSVVTGAQIACGPFDMGDVAVVATGGGVEYVSDGSVIPDAGMGEAVYDATGRTAGGVHLLDTCSVPGCSIVAADFDGDGDEEVATADGTTLTVRTLAGEVSVFAPGVVGATDADGDGLPDVIVADRGQVRVYQVLAGGLSWPWATYLWRPSSGPAQWGDLDGDALPDLFLVGYDDNPDDGTDWTGTLIYASATSAG